MWGRTTICVAAGATAALIWYLFFRRYNRRQGEQVVAWIQTALAGMGEVVAVRWLGPAFFQVTARLDTTLFQQPALLVRLVPRQMPLLWLKQWWRREPATITWQADLDVPPAFNLQVGQHRWSGRSRRRLVPERARWTMEPVTPLILTSRRGWPREVNAMMNALLSCRKREVLSLAFRPTSPHFSATIPLECISPERGAGANVLDTLRELAAGASASRM
jgi:hypothetical protein